MAATWRRLLRRQPGPVTPPADRPEPVEEMLRRLDWTVLRPIALRLGGDARSAVRGSGIDLAEIREYQPGDDVRFLDWGATARTGRPHVRQTFTERALDVWLLVDVSPSVDWGTARRSKHSHALELVAAIARVVGRRNHRVGAILFAERPLDVLPPAVGRHNLLRLLARIREAPRRTELGQTSLTAALDLARTVIRRPSIVVIVSDLLVADGWQHALAKLAVRHEVVSVRVVDPREGELPDVGIVTLEDPETGEQLLVDTADRRLRERFAEAARTQAASIDHALAVCSVRRVVASTGADLLPPLLELLDRRRLAAARRGAAVATLPAPARLILAPSPVSRPWRPAVMTFEWPILLWSLALVPLLLVLYALAQRRRRAYAVRFTNLALLREVVGRRPGLRRHVPPLFFLLGLGALLVSLARPTAVVAIPRDESSVMLVIDVSGSMTAKDLQPSRMEAARLAAQSFVQTLPPNTRVGLVSFASRARMESPLTKDRAAVLGAIRSLDAEGGTAIGDGLALAVDLLRRDATTAASGASEGSAGSGGAGSGTTGAGETPGTIVLLSDGASSTGQPPRQAAARASQSGVVVHTVGVGQRASGARVGARAAAAELDERTLQEIAGTTGGEYFYAAQTTDLQKIYANISSRVSWSEERTEVTALVSAAGTLLLLAAGLFSLRWLHSLP